MSDMAPVLIGVAVAAALYAAKARASEPAGAGAGSRSGAANAVVRPSFSLTLAGRLAPTTTNNEKSKPQKARSVADYANSDIIDQLVSSDDQTIAGCRKSFRNENDACKQYKILSADRKQCMKAYREAKHQCIENVKNPLPVMRCDAGGYPEGYVTDGVPCPVPADWIPEKSYLFAHWPISRMTPAQQFAYGMCQVTGVGFATSILLKGGNACDNSRFVASLPAFRSYIAKQCNNCACGKCAQGVQGPAGCGGCAGAVATP